MPVKPPIAMSAHLIGTRPSNIDTDMVPPMQPGKRHVTFNEVGIA